MRQSLAVIILLLVNNLSFGKVKIADENCISNRPGGFCLYASLETLGRHHRIPKLYGLVEKKYKTLRTQKWDRNGYRWEPNGVSTWNDATRELDAKAIKYTLSVQRDYRLIERACNDGIGCVIGLKPIKGQTGHAVVLVEVTAEYVVMVDSDHTWFPRSMTRADFERQWSGAALVFEMSHTKV